MGQVVDRIALTFFSPVQAGVWSERGGGAAGKRGGACMLVNDGPEIPAGTSPGMLDTQVGS